MFCYIRLNCILLVLNLFLFVPCFFPKRMISYYNVAKLRMVIFYLNFVRKFKRASKCIRLQWENSVPMRDPHTRIMVFRNGNRDGEIYHFSRHWRVNFKQSSQTIVRCNFLGGKIYPCLVRFSINSPPQDNIFFSDNLNSLF